MRGTQCINTLFACGMSVKMLNISRANAQCLLALRVTSQAKIDESR